MLVPWPTSIPSPDQNAWYLGPLPIRAYALAIVLGIVAATWIAQRRWVRRGGDANDMFDLLIWIVPFGIVGGRLYHVITSPDAYFGPDGNPAKAIAIWEGGLGIWGAVALGALGCYLACRRYGIPFAEAADAIAPGLLVAQAIGRLGNWFNQELFGAPTTLPWGLEIDAAHLPPGFVEGTLFHPTFLYEMVWNLIGVAVLLWAERTFRLRHGRVFALYVIWYTCGRGLIEMIRIDEAQIIAGLRLNVWTSLIVGISALVIFVMLGRRHPEPEELASADPEESADTEGSVDPEEPEGTDSQELTGAESSDTASEKSSEEIS